MMGMIIYFVGMFIIWLLLLTFVYFSDENQSETAYIVVMMSFIWPVMLPLAIILFTGLTVYTMVDNARKRRVQRERK